MVEIRSGAGAAIVTEETLVGRFGEALLEHVAEEPPWSDFPFILLTSGGGTTRASVHMVNLLGPSTNVTLLERPVRALTLVHSEVERRFLERQLERVL